LRTTLNNLLILLDVERTKSNKSAVTPHIFYDVEQLFLKYK